jgi:hypothetical protein
MTGNQTSSEAKRKEIEKYLSALRPEIQVVVLRDLELAELRGEDFGSMFRHVMSKLRYSIRKAGLKYERVGSPARLFFMPVEPYLVDGSPDNAAPATVPRRCLNPIWAWLCREMMPDEAQQYADTCSRALVAGDRGAAIFTATVFRERFVELAGKAQLASVARSLVKYGAPRTASADFGSLLTAIKNHERLSDIGKLLPGSTLEKIPNLDSDTAAQAKAALTEVEDQLLANAIVLMMSRLTVPWEIARVVKGDSRLEKTAKQVAFGRLQALLSHRDTCGGAGHAEEAERVAARIVAMADAIEAEFDLAPDGPEAALCRFARCAAGSARPAFPVRHGEAAMAGTATSVAMAL